MKGLAGQQVFKYLPETMRPELLDILPTVRRPSRYLGNEKNSVRKDLVGKGEHTGSPLLKVALCYPDSYEVGMSHIGTQILYHLLNDRPEIACERVYAPWIDMEQRLRETGLPLTTLESNIPLRELDILGITLPFELTDTNILTILSLGGIPFLAKDRDETFPLILGGGTGAYNPEPVADFFDAILIGDGEEAILEICEVVKKWKCRGGVLPPGHENRAPTKQELLRQLAAIPGIYVPSFFQPHYEEDGTLEKIEPLVDGYPGVRKRVVGDLDSAYYPRQPILPHTKVIHDRVGVEVQRGCVRGCRFCQAGYIDRPERQRSPETVKEIVRDQIAATGQEEVSLVSLSIGDYDCLTPLLKDLMDEHGKKNVAISIPATRVEQLSPAIMEEIKRVRKTGFTIAPEAATDRMREVINKGNSEENLMTTVRAVFSHGWRLMKFYFMIGLPTETDEDVTAIADLGHRVMQEGLRFNRQAEINLGVSAFVPKPFTPFQWEPQNSLEETGRKLSLLRSRIRSRRLHLKPHRPETTYLEGIFSRGDRRLSRLIVRAWEKGCRFDEWDEGLRFNLWKEAWEECGIDPKFYVERRREKGEVLPWDHLFIDMKKDWLWEEYQASLQTAAFFNQPQSGVEGEAPAALPMEGATRAPIMDDCSTGKCTVCGVCDYKEIRNRAYERPRLDDSGKVMKRKTTTEIRHYDLTRPDGHPLLVLTLNKGGERGQTYHCHYSKSGPAAFLSHLEFVDAIRRAVARAGLPVKFSQGFHPLPRIAFGDAAPVGKEVTGEFKMELERLIEPEDIYKHLERELPEGIFLEEITQVNAKSPSPPPPSLSLSPSP